MDSLDVNATCKSILQISRGIFYMAKSYKRTYSTKVTIQK